MNRLSTVLLPPVLHRATAWRGSACLGLVLGLAACSMPMSEGGAPRASAKLVPTQGQSVSGQVNFSTVGEQVAVRVQLAGLPPNSEHGFHLHEKGDCSAPDGMSTGGHFNPTQKPHGPQHMDHHAGDMPSLKSDAAGKVDTRFMLTGVSIGSGVANIVGRGLIVHAKPDDYTTQPTGNSGARIACGVVAGA